MSFPEQPFPAIPDVSYVKQHAYVRSADICHFHKLCSYFRIFSTSLIMTLLLQLLCKFVLYFLWYLFLCVDFIVLYYLLLTILFVSSYWLPVAVFLFFLPNTLINLLNRIDCTPYLSCTSWSRYQSDRPWGSKHLWNVDIFWQNYTVQQPRNQFHIRHRNNLKF